MKILFVTQWFQPEPTMKGLPFAKELLRRGHEVEVLTGFPNYPEGKVYDGYKVKFLQREEIDGVSVIRVPLYPSHDSSNLRRIFNYVSYSLSASLIGPWTVKKADVAYIYHPPPTTYLPGAVIRLLRRIPTVYDIQDLWPDTLTATGMFKSPIGIKLVNAWCNFVYKSTNQIVVLSPGFKDILIERGVAPEKIEVIYNWCDDKVIHPMEPDLKQKKELGLENRFNIIFAGNMGKAQALDAVLDAASLIADSCPKAQFVFVGGGVDVDRLKQKVSDMKLSNVKFINQVPREEIAGILNLADVLMVHLKNDPLFQITIPSKTQAYMSIGKPVLMGVKGNAADLITEAKAGLVCEPETPESIAHAVEQFYSMPCEGLEEMGNNGREHYNEHLSLKAGVEHFESLFNSVIKKK